MKTGQVDLPLHYGKAPRWLFWRMVKLAKPISQIIIKDYGQDEFLKRISNPYFFQAFGCVLGFDWHSSGLTTTATATLKEALKDLGIEVAGGKGKTSRKTPAEIAEIGDKFGLSEKKINNLVRASKLAAKVDNNLIQDSYNLYHHSFFISEKGRWAVVQQGLSAPGYLKGYARRYHWLSKDVKDYIEYGKPIISMGEEKEVLDLTSKKSRETRKVSLDLIKENLVKLKRFEEEKTKAGQKTLNEFSKFSLPSRHEILKIDLGNFKALEKAYDLQPKDYEELLMVKGMGAKTIRALSLISSLVYGSQLSWKDPAKYSYAHGGKDGIPYPVDREEYDRSTEILNLSLKEAKIENREKLKALKRIGALVG
jgi:hypothetical protein